MIVAMEKSPRRTLKKHAVVHKMMAKMVNPIENFLILLFFDVLHDQEEI